MYSTDIKTTYILDFDSTLVSVESLDELARMGFTKLSDGTARLTKLHELTIQGMDGTLQFAESLQRRVGLLQATRADVRLLTEELKSAITDSARECKEWFIENADDIYVVSGGFEDYIVPVVAELGISKSHVFANRFIYNEEECITGYDTSALLSKTQGKVAQVDALQLIGKVIIIGDGFTDYEVCRHGKADEFWAFTKHIARPSVAALADRTLTSFKEILLSVPAGIR